MTSKWYDVKRIGRRYYLYLRWREGDKVRSRYLGRWYGPRETAGRLEIADYRGDRVDVSSIVVMRPAPAKELRLCVVWHGRACIAWGWSHRNDGYLRVYRLGRHWERKARLVLDSGVDWPGWVLEWLDTRPGQVVAIYRCIGMDAWRALPDERVILRCDSGRYGHNCAPAKPAP
jgi:hypothetical protein